MINYICISFRGNQKRNAYKYLTPFPLNSKNEEQIH